MKTSNKLLIALLIVIFGIVTVVMAMAKYYVSVHVN